MRKLTGRAGLGVSSIVLILVTLCLTVFSALALMSARIDALTTERMDAAAQSYYAADKRAQLLLAEADVLLEGGGAATDIPGVTAEGEGFAFTVPVDETRTLFVQFTVEDGACRVTAYRVTAAAAAADNGLHLYGGDAGEGQ